MAGFYGNNFTTASAYKIGHGFFPATPYANIHRYYFGGAGNDTYTGGSVEDHLVGGAVGDTYSYQAGDSIVRIKDALIAGDTNTLKFGAGITAGQIKLGLGSLKLDLGNGEEIHLDGFNPDDAFNTSTIQRFEFDGGTLTTAELLARGFDLDGTAENDTITGTNTTDRIAGLGGDDTLNGGALFRPVSRIAKSEYKHIDATQVYRLSA